MTPDLARHILELHRRGYRLSPESDGVSMSMVKPDGSIVPVAIDNVETAYRFDACEYLQERAAIIVESGGTETEAASMSWVDLVARAKFLLSNA